MTTVTEETFPRGLVAFPLFANQMKSFGLHGKKGDESLFLVFLVMDVTAGGNNEHFFVWEPGTLPALFPSH